MKDYVVTKEEFLENKCFSGHYFYEHAKYILKKIKNIPNMSYKLYRYKNIISLDDNIIILKAHDHHTRKYITGYDKKHKELFTLHCDISPKVMFNVILSYLKNMNI